MREQWRMLALAAYYWATLPMRKRRLRRWAFSGTAPITILFYHRVHEDRATPWTTHPRAFRRQMTWLLEHADLISLQEAQARLVAGNFGNRPAVAVTFDDGYEDNLREALPLLIEHAVPCTYFVTAENVLRGKAFEHDALFGVAPLPHTPAQVRDLAASGVEIGSHAWSHCDFGALSADETQRQLTDSRRALEDITAAPVVRFAFPFGRPENSPPTAIAAARRCGYVAVCTAHGGYNVPRCEGFLLRRFHGDDPWVRMVNRVTVDLRLMRLSERFSPINALEPPHPGAPANVTDASAIERTALPVSCPLEEPAASPFGLETSANGSASSCDVTVHS
ncbi:MAG: polysaccharide deacetylase family protein [Thermogutta sp.]